MHYYIYLDHISDVFIICLHCTKLYMAERSQNRFATHQYIDAAFVIASGSQDFNVSLPDKIVSK